MKYTLLIAVLSACNVCYSQHADSLDASRSHRLPRALAAPATLISVGFAIKGQDEFIRSHFVRPDGEEQNPKASMDIADYSQYAPIVLVYGMQLMNHKGEHKFLKSTSLLLQSEALMIAVVWPMKYLVNEPRPDGGYHSFPSGHTAQAFVAATFLHKEYGHKSVWYSIAGYTMASAVGMCRVVSNRHWASDVLVGAGVGILTTNLVYLNHKHRRKTGTHLTAMPTYNRGPGFHLAMRL